MEPSFAFLFLVALGTTFTVMPIGRRLGIKVGLLDHPHRRKIQMRVVPRTGGIGILFGVMAGTALLWRLAGDLGVPITRELVAIFGGAVLIHVTGILDDLLDLRPGVKLTAQMLAVGLVVSQGVIVERLVFPSGVAWELGFLGIPLTAFFLLGFINALNLVDGLDGLAAGIVAIGALTLAILGLLNGNYVLAAFSTILLGASLGFLPYNFSERQKTFLGDSGSMLLGYLLGVVAISGAWFSGHSAPIFVVVACAAIPILDTVTTIARRYRKRQALFRPDSMHIHHRMIRFGLSPRRAVLTILALTFFSAGQALVFFAEGTKLLIVTTSLAALLVFLQIRHQRKLSLADTDSSFREILFYLIGARDGEGPRLDGELAMVDVIAGSESSAKAAPAEGSPAARPVPGWVKKAGERPPVFDV
jgi:UDP-GlcNAc:undecaprenyl-phosphate GlcNAc-1-phosphate transferase